MFLAFEKWHGCRNDFIVTWLPDSGGEVVVNSLKRQAVDLCDRRGGIGGDGVLVLHTRSSADLTPYALTIINSDGSLAKTCGNGLRCAALSVLKAHRERGNPKELPELVELQVAGEALVCRFIPGRDAQPLVVVDMGVPSLGRQVAWCEPATAAWQACMKAHGLAAADFELGVCSIGNPHLVITSDLASRDLLLKIGPALQQSPAWDGINVHLVRPRQVSAKDQARASAQLGQQLSELYEAFVWERGAGETMACGSGACAIGALALASGLLARGEWVGVDMPGGRLYVKQDQPASPVQLAGPGAFVFNGKVVL